MLLLVFIHAHLQYKGIFSSCLVLIFIDKVLHGHSFLWDATSMTIHIDRNSTFESLKVFR